MGRAIISDMEKIGDIRYRNTRSLIEEFCDKSRQLKDFAERIGVQSGYASGMATPKEDKRTRPIGDSMARRIEKAFNKEKNWLDTPHYASSEVSDLYVSEEKAPYGAQPQISSIQTIPLLSGKELLEWINGSVPLADNHIVFPALPMMKLSSKAFAFKETTNMMPPMEPGDFYYVDPGHKPEPGSWALFLVEGHEVVGIVEKGWKGMKLTFSSSHEEPIQVTDDQCIGKILTRMKVTT